MELSQRIVVEKSVINQYEQVQNHLKTSEISIENSKRVVLSDNNSSSTSTMIEKSKEKMTESNGMVQNCERYSGKECLVESSIKSDDDLDDVAKPKSSSSCSDLLIFCQSQPKIKPEMEQTATVADFTIPYNIINNYFSGLYIRRALQKEDSVYTMRWRKEKASPISISTIYRLFFLVFLFSQSRCRRCHMR